MKKRNFTQISNHLLNDKELTLKAKGLFAYMQSKPKKWNFHLNGMQKQLKESRGTIIKIINELVMKGYINKIKSTKNGKQQINQYVLYEKVESQHIGVKYRESKNCTNSNTTLSNTIKSNTLKRRDSFQKFKTKIIENYQNQSFCTQGIGWLNSTLFQITETGYLLNKEDAFKVWQYLYKNFEKGELFHETNKS